MLTPPTPVGAPLIYPPLEGGYWPSPVQGLKNWVGELAQIIPQAGLL